MVDPTNKFSFLSYLLKKKRIYPFLHKKSHAVSRAEFNDYLKWAVSEMDNLIFGHVIDTIIFDKGKFIIQTHSGIYQSKNIVIGTGTTPNIPDVLIGSLSNCVFHNSEYKKRRKRINFSDKRIAVIGGGQSGAEIVDDILSGYEQPAEIAWISKRDNFFSLQDSCFSNDFYSPSFSRYFFNLTEKSRKRKNNSLLLTSDGITENLLNTIYRKIYDIKYIKNLNIKISLYPRHRVKKIQHQNGMKILKIINIDKNNSFKNNFDVIILATGYKARTLSILNSIFPDAKSIDDIEIDMDFSVKWKHINNKIFIQSGLKTQFGIADPNLSLSTWRNAVIINSILDKNHYDTSFNSIMFNEYNQ